MECESKKRGLERDIKELKNEVTDYRRNISASDATVTELK